MREIPLNLGYVALVDDEDYDFVMSLNPKILIRRWHRHAYVLGVKHGAMFAISRCLMNPPEGLVVCFKDGNRQNLQKDNLYICKRKDIPQAPPRKFITPLVIPDDIEVKEYKSKEWKSKLKAPPTDKIFVTKKAEEDTRRKQMVQDLIQEKRLYVATWDDLSEVFKDYYPDYWEPPKRED